MNWIQLAASRLRKGISFMPDGPRERSRRLTSAGFGVMRRAPVSGHDAERRTLRGKRTLAAPSFGLLRSFQVPSAVRKYRTPSGGTRPRDWNAVSEPSG